MRPPLAALALSLAAPVAGCAPRGPFFPDPAVLPAAGAAPAKLVVSHFYWQDQRVPGTLAAGEPREATRVETAELSELLAGILKDGPLPGDVEARLRAQPGALAPGEVLLRGYVFNNGKAGYTGELLSALVSIFTGFVIGGLFPYPVPVTEKCKVRYQVNLSAPGQRPYYLEKETITAVYKHDWIWSLFSDPCGAAKYQRGVTSQIAGAVSGALVGP